MILLLDKVELNKPQQKKPYSVSQGFIFSGTCIDKYSEMAYGKSADLADFLDSMNRGCTASIEADGVKAAIEDGAYLGQVLAETGMDEAALQELAEELHAALSVKK